jgi:predicted RNA methylase
MRGVIYQDEKIVITLGMIRIRDRSSPAGKVSQVRTDQMSIFAYPAAILGYGGLFALLVQVSRHGWVGTIADLGLGTLVGWGFIGVALAAIGAKYLTRAVRIDVAGEEVLAYSTFSSAKVATVRAAIERAISGSFDPPKS